MKKLNNYEQYIFDRAARCGYPGPQDLADAMEMSMKTLDDRVRNRNNWRLDEMRRMQMLLQLNTREWILLFLYHATPYDEEYHAVARSVFDSILRNSFVY